MRECPILRNIAFQTLEAPLHESFLEAWTDWSSWGAETDEHTLRPVGSLGWKLPDSFRREELDFQNKNHQLCLIPNYSTGDTRLWLSNPASVAFESFVLEFAVFRLQRSRSVVKTICKLELASGFLSEQRTCNKNAFKMSGCLTHGTWKLWWYPCFGFQQVLESFGEFPSTSVSLDIISQHETLHPENYYN